MTRTGQPPAPPANTGPAVARTVAPVVVGPAHPAAPGNTTGNTGTGSPAAPVTAAPAATAPAANLVPARVYLRAADVPPRGVGAYGIVALSSKPTPANRQRLLMTCTAYVTHLPRQDALPGSVAVADQMLTIWPLDDPDAPQTKTDDCNFAIDHYDLYGGISAIQDSERQGAKLAGDGPFLIGWSPSNTRGVPDKIVLVLNLSSFDSQDSFDAAFLLWQQKIVEDPTLWRHGFSLEPLRLAIRDFVDHYGPDVVQIWGAGQ